MPARLQQSVRRRKEPSSRASRFQNSLRSSMRRQAKRVLPAVPGSQAKEPATPDAPETNNDVTDAIAQVLAVLDDEPALPTASSSTRPAVNLVVEEEEEEDQTQEKGKEKTESFTRAVRQTLRRRATLSQASGGVTNKARPQAPDGSDPTTPRNQAELEDARPAMQRRHHVSLKAKPSSVTTTASTTPASATPVRNLKPCREMFPTSKATVAHSHRTCSW